MKEEVLITGGLCYVGGRVARHLAESSSFDLRLGVRRHIPAPDWLKNGKLVALDLLDEATLTEACRGVKHVIHFAALNEIESGSDPEQALVVNGLGSLTAEIQTPPGVPAPHKES